ncbi:MAG TPA: hypothetical protein VMU39_13055 [Solirubrobacteraceae bacterium]|nr:hypothetical protein [Solirubrobacteraceae bacterium]
MALLATGVAIAAGVNPFAGIGAADHAQVPQDILDPAVVAQIQSHNEQTGALSPGSLLPDTSRLLGQLTDGRSIYVVKTTKDGLCVLVTDQSKLEVFSCGHPLTQPEPVTVGTFDQVVNGPGATPPLAYGIAQDGINAVSFTADGSEQTVPVKDNVWFYEGDSNVLATITVHYSDGTTQTVTR